MNYSELKNSVGDTEYATIAAISTPPGAGGIAIIRLSGPKAHELARQVFRPWPTAPEYFRLYLGHVYAPETSGMPGSSITSFDSAQPLDQVFLVLMPTGRSYTREPLAEIHCHGGRYLSCRILELFYELGAIPAAPGEFTRRAYLNGRLDLAQAEAVAALIAADSEAALRAATAQLEGSFSRRIRELLVGVETLLAAVESELDFLAEEGKNYVSPQLFARLTTLFKQGCELLAARQRGRFCQEGLKVVLAGRPNVGKSSLFNALLAEERALVSSRPGTTRDVVSAAFELAGIRVELSDTAGLDQPRDELEKLGMDRTVVWLSRADLVLLVLDRSCSLTAADLKLLRQVKSRPHLVILNKCDLPAAFTQVELAPHLSDDAVLVACSARGLEPGIGRLLAALTDFIESAAPAAAGSTVVLNQRHFDLLQSFVKALERAIELLRQPLYPLDLLAEELHLARRSLLDITGHRQDAAETLLDAVFSRFCVGK